MLFHRRRNPNSSQPQSQTEEQLHYRSLIELFKYSLTLLLGVFGIIGYITYKDGKEMRDELKAEREEAKAQIKEMKAELEKEKEILQKNITRKILQIDNDLALTSSHALGEINNIKNVAITESRIKIEEVFKTKNLEEFIDQEAQRIVGEKIENIVDDRINESDQRSIATAIEELNSLDPFTVIMSCSNLTFNYINKLSEDNLSEIIKILNKQNSSSLKEQIIILLIYQKSRSVTEYFKKELLDEKEEPYDSQLITSLIRNDPESNTEIYQKILNKSNDKSNTFRAYISASSIFNKKLLIQFLNSKKTIDDIKVAQGDAYDNYKKDIYKTIKEQAKGFDCGNTYFYLNK